MMLYCYIRLRCTEHGGREGLWSDCDKPRETIYGERGFGTLIVLFVDGNYYYHYANQGRI